MPVEAGVQSLLDPQEPRFWIPASSGMTGLFSYFPAQYTNRASEASEHIEAF